MNTQIMGVLNVTPDSFSDGGEFFDAGAAISHGLQLAAQGADIIDVGGESTRPGATRITADEEQRRVIPVITELAEAGLTISIDTVNAATARAAVAAGASIINDVSGGTADPGMLRVAADTGARFIIMHWRGIPDPGHSRSQYEDVVAEVRDELGALVSAALASGVTRENIVLDPGLGFDKTTVQGWQLLAGIDELRALGFPLLVGVSRKRMLREVIGSESATSEQDIATAAVSALAAREGLWGVRVHNVAATAAAIRVVDALNAADRAVSPGALWPMRGAGCEHARGAGQERRRASARERGRVAGAHVSEQSEAATQPDAAEDHITLTGLEVIAHHGVFEFEREQGQRFVIDAEVSVDLREASASDELSRTVHYGELAEALLTAAERDPVDLIETLAERLATVALQFDGVRTVTLTVHKPDAPIDAVFEDVSVTITRAATRPAAAVRPTPIVLALGANLPGEAGDRGETIAATLRELAETDGISGLRSSTLRETIALTEHGLDPLAPRYLNGIALAETTLAPHELLDLLQEIEQRHGRVRETKWGDRTLDIDLISYGELVSSDPRLTLPHPRAHERDFVLAPWCELDPEATLAGHGRVDVLLARLEGAATAETAVPAETVASTETVAPAKTAAATVPHSSEGLTAENGDVAR